MEFIVLVVLIGLIPAAIANSKGRSFVLWWIYGSALFIIALPHALIMGPAGAKRTCPHCGEYMLSTATVCPHCSREVAGQINAPSDRAFGDEEIHDSVIVLQRARDVPSAAWLKVRRGKRLKLTSTSVDPPGWSVESEDGILGAVGGVDAKRVAFFAETEGRPRGTVARIDTTEEGEAYQLGFSLSAVPAA